MRPPSIVLDLILGVIVGAFGYALVIGFLPRIRGPVTLTILVVLAFLAVALRRNGGSLRGPVDPGLAGPRWTLDRVMTTDIAAVRVPVILFKAVLGLAIAGLLLAVLVPAASAGGVTVPDWAARIVLLVFLALAVVPDLWRRFRSRR